MNSKELEFVFPNRWDTCKYRRSLELRSLRMVDPSHRTIRHISSFLNLTRDTQSYFNMPPLAILAPIPRLVV
jgi:hypothetical protein